MARRDRLAEGDVGEHRVGAAAAVSGRGGGRGDLDGLAVVQALALDHDDRADDENDDDEKDDAPAGPRPVPVRDDGGEHPVHGASAADASVEPAPRYSTLHRSAP